MILEIDPLVRKKRPGPKRRFIEAVKDRRVVVEKKEDADRVT